MDFLPYFLQDLLDWLLSGVIVPLFTAISKALEFFLIKPLELLNAPLWLQIVFIALFTALISILIRKLLRVDEKEAEFQRRFAERKAAQELIEKLDDWKKQAVLYDASDKELDEEFNQYLAQRFARYGLTYLLPIFLILFWVDHLPKVVDLKEKTGAAFVIIFPKKILGIPGVSIPLLFLVVYCVVIIGYFKLRPRQNRL